MFKREEIIEMANKDFEKAWIETKGLIKSKRVNESYPRIKPIFGKTHPVNDTIENLRQAYLRMGFEEYINPVIVDERDIYKQFGPEAMAVLDRCFYLAGLPRPDVGLSDEKISQIEKLGINVSCHKESLQKILHGYKKGTLDGDDLVLEISKALEISSEMGLKILEEVFPEFKDLIAVSSKLTLRSHMTSGWFITLSELNGKKPLPFKLFSIDRCFRREQKEDKSHLMTYHSASCVIAGKDVDINDGKAVAEGLLSQFGFTNFKFIPDEKKSKYYTPETQTEVYAYHPKLKEWLEVATFGVYSPVALSKYGIDVPVMNLGLGVERLSMISGNFEDVREMVYPQFYEQSLSDRAISSMVKFDKVPVLDEIYDLTKELIDLCVKNKDITSPCNLKLEKTFIFGKTKKNVKIIVFEKEENKKLLGPSILNEIYVYDGNIIGIPETFEGVKEEFKEFLEKGKVEGVTTGIRYIDALCFKITSKVEEAFVSNTSEFKLKVPIVRSLSDINLKIEEIALKQIMSKNKVIDVRGPVFLNVEVKIE
ncbi:O-phosphoseryl-tRNA(Cys) synthetase [Methanococcus vannielii SB]|uniref:O-phosphoserine--tRNA(Cys) ligase n=1 Tax=Methanococcus vannielii (strain ATCC 35089 / DSM 1224 / JCM 13029 / OCM 148 / SB) TaxID=406327 RepID=SEPS_METVS|nr:O-phosphoserine--tRNA ligase [Methanococcus vannielii]A6USJ0.1 RecName: Full=O-phosphoserine--tRNA(Cys) ligase; Short=O-phosphoserine--tRNA ligase; AltName: Full=Non-canonical O-phosphoseryl-tRNA(Cys) synthetase; AltName: Full=O-phosphoseryl-tRNA(Cys) synthetase; Short=SepRS [Methanococcus vannielii SB]ABR55462.1 O-phosphoseryl-tRNA(Cys) synthetase [Methanococcus vannielii SB]